MIVVVNQQTRTELPIHQRLFHVNLAKSCIHNLAKAILVVTFQPDTADVREKSSSIEDRMIEKSLPLRI
jgi:hypothetical protein